MEKDAPGGARRHAGRSLSAWRDKLFARHTSSLRPHLPAPSSGSGHPPRAGSGQRSKSIGLAGERQRLARDYRPGSGWQSLALAAIVVMVAAVTFAPADVLDRILHGPPRLALSRPDVLVVSGSPSDHAATTHAVQPRGYSVRTAANVESGLEDLRREPGRIGFVVIDKNIAGARRMISAVKKTCPEARLILLDGPREMGRISHLLVDAGMD